MANITTNVSKIEVKGGIAHEYMGQLKNLVYQGSLAIVEIGRLLLIFRNEKLYTQLGHETFERFISDSDLGFAPKTAYAFCRIYEVYVMKFKLSEDELAMVPWSKLQALAPVVSDKDKDEALEWLEKARNLGSGDFYDEVAEHKRGKGIKNRPPYPKIRLCKDCKKWRVEFEQGASCICV